MFHIVEESMHIPLIERVSGFVGVLYPGDETILENPFKFQRVIMSQIRRPDRAQRQLMTQGTNMLVACSARPSNIIHETNLVRAMTNRVYLKDDPFPPNTVRINWKHANPRISHCRS